MHLYSVNVSVDRLLFVPSFIYVIYHIIYIGVFYYSFSSKPISIHVTERLATVIIVTLRILKHVRSKMRNNCELLLFFCLTKSDSRYSLPIVDKTIIGLLVILEQKAVEHLKE